MTTRYSGACHRAAVHRGLAGPVCGNAVRGRIAWKYVLGLEFADPGCDFSILCEFHACLIAGGVERTLLDTMSGLPAIHDKGERSSDRDGLVTSGAFPDVSAAAVRSTATPLSCRPVRRRLSYQRHCLCRTIRQQHPNGSYRRWLACGLKRGPCAVEQRQCPLLGVALDGTTGAPCFPYVRLHFGQGHARRAVVTLQGWRSSLILHGVVPPLRPACLAPRLSAASR
jgi:hypothetical protein